MNYRVGQILYVVLNRKMQVYPMMVVEEIVKKTLQGEETNYVLQGGTNASDTLLLNQVDGEIFESAEEAKYVLTNRATQQIEKIVDTAVIRASEWYNNNLQEPVVAQQAMTLPTDSDVVKVELPDGTIANLKSPSSMAR